jgi:methionyl aminopeptidase
MTPQDALLKAGKIASEVRNEALSLIEPRRKVLEICEFVRRLIKEKGGKQAFPCNLDINEIAAHYTSPHMDRTMIPDDALVKLDIGVHINGYIADTAVTVNLDPAHRPQVEAANAALEAAISMVRDGVYAGDIGAAIERAIKGRGFKPISNLTGHRMSRFIVHSGQSIPNVAQNGTHQLHAGDVYAIEPFSVPHSASGLVQDGPPSNIYRFVKKRKVKGDVSKRMMKYIQSEYKSLPFASRWVIEKFPRGSDTFRELVQSKSISSYPQLIERTRMPVAQAEHTIIVTEDGCLVTTA